MGFNVPEFSVSDFSRTIKRVVEDAFGYVKIKGEITGFKKAASGHLYFSLKDEDASLSAVCFRNMANMINFEMADGLQVCVSGRVTTFEGRSNYQIIVEKVEISGIGAILEMLEKRKKKLAAEGLFDDEHKQELPFYPRTIGVITSQTGAVLQDIKHRIADRCPTNLKLYPTLVQGPKAAANIIKAIKYFNRVKKSEKPEVIIIARGGGSFEDLLPFNDEELVREVFACDIPIITAIGHETDTSLVDFASDLRAPTPTAAAEMAVPVLAELKAQMSYLEERLEFLPKNILAEKMQHIKNLQKYIISPDKLLEQVKNHFIAVQKEFLGVCNSFISNKMHQLSSIQISKEAILNKIDLLQQKNTHFGDSLQINLRNSLKDKQNNLDNISKLLQSYHYHEVLKRGFSMVRDPKGNIISSMSQVKTKEIISVEISDGEFKSYVVDVDRDKNRQEINKKSEIIQPKLI